MKHILKLTVLACLSSAPAWSHDAKTGWSYPLSCCSGVDCREVSTGTVGTSANGYVIKQTGEVIPYTSRKIRYSPDGVYHWCSVAGKPDTATICLFVPPQLF